MPQASLKPSWPRFASSPARPVFPQTSAPASCVLSSFTTEFAHQPDAVTEAQIACGLRKAFGREYEGVRAHRAMYQASANPDLGGAQRLRELMQREERAKQHRVPYHVGPHEARFSRVLALFTDTEVNGFFNELSANARCS